MRHAGQVVTRTMLLEGVWDYHFDPQTNVIDVHVSRLRQKVDKPFPTPLIHTVRNAGYMLRPSSAVTPRPGDVPLPRWFHTAGFRFGAIYALLLSISAFAMAIFLWWATAGLLDRETDAAIYADAQDLATRGAMAVFRRSPARSMTGWRRMSMTTRFICWWKGMQRVAGNLSAWPAGVDETNVAYELPCSALA